MTYTRYCFSYFTLMPPSGVFPHILSVIATRAHIATRSCPVRMEKLASRLVNPFVGVGSEKVALRLQQVRRRLGCAISIKEG